MPNLSHTVTPTPPQPLPITFDRIKQLEGLYCLNDLHKASGGRDKHRPHEFFRSEAGKAVTDELEREFKLSEFPTPYKKVVIGKGKAQGTYVCLELVYAYAMWISPAFHIKVIRTFHHVATGEQLPSYSERVNTLCSQIAQLEGSLTIAGRTLCIGGKHLKPALEQQLTQLLDTQQMTLTLGA